jgi:hypothetical protein
MLMLPVLELPVGQAVHSVAPLYCPAPHGLQG